MSYFKKFTLIGSAVFLMQSCTVLPRLEIGPTNAKQSVVKTTIAAGLTHFQVKISSGNNQYTLASQLMSDKDAKLLMQKIMLITNSLLIDSPLSGLEIIIEDFNEFNGSTLNLGKKIFLGRFNSTADALVVDEQLSKQGVYLKTINTSSLAFTEGNFEVSILKVDPVIYAGKVHSILANNNVQGLATVSEIATQVNAVASVNGGFFAYKEDQGIPGDPAGISVIDGTLVSEAIINRPALLIKNKPTLSFNILNKVSTSLSVGIDGHFQAIDGINRKLKYKFNCGYDDDGLTVPASHDVVCKDEDEAVIYDQNFGDIADVLNQENFTFWIDKSQNIYLRPNATQINYVPDGHYLVAVSGNKRELFESLVLQGSTAEFRQVVYNEGNQVILEKGMYIINGGPSLLVNNETQESNWEMQGWSPFVQDVGSQSLDKRDEAPDSKQVQQSRKDFYDGWVMQRHPRTAVGLSIDGALYVVVIYGREPLRSMGASVPEMANIMRSLGAVNALNLDGGGSSVMVVNGRMTGNPSDNTGERKVADTLVFVSAGRE
ncbi:MAG: exopolysaccharide biosynthesis protein [Paraglaciecola sp.]|jgi:exopolysaccharide biosynthesis protein